MYVPWQLLAEETLRNMIDAYCTQLHGLCSDEMFDSLDERRAQVFQALEQGTLLIRWSESEESAWIVDPRGMRDS